MGNFRGWEWIVILLLALLLFGGFKKLPDAARGIGRSLRIFKAETKGLVDDDSAEKSTADATPTSGTPEITATPAPPATSSPVPPAPVAQTAAAPAPVAQPAPPAAAAPTAPSEPTHPSSAS